MITLSTFQEYLSSTEAEQTALHQSFNSQQRHLLKELTSLPSQTEKEQAEQLEGILAELRVADVDEKQRIKLTAIVIDAAEQLIATLRQHYIYETGALDEEQLGHMAQIQSLYYLIIMVYDGVIRREISLLANHDRQPFKNVWQRYLKQDQSSPITLSIAIYQSLLMYQRLLGEETLCYQKPSSYLWSKINQLYHLAHQQRATGIDLSVYTVTQRADNIHRLYCQICLHSLLNVRAFRRPNVLLVQRLLPEWAEHLVATIEPQTETRVFVDLRDDQPPTYLTANSTINPYEDRHDCLFIELAPMVEYLKSRKQVLIDEDSEGVESCLLNKIAMAVDYRYLKPQLTQPAIDKLKQQAVLMGGFNDIHYRVSDSRRFTNLIVTKSLPEGQRPHYDTFTNNQDGSVVLNVETFDSNDEMSIFRSLRLAVSTESVSAHKDSALQKTLPVGRMGSAVDRESIAGKDKGNQPIADDKSTDNKSIDSKSIYSKNIDDKKATSPFPLQIMSLFLLCRSESKDTADWSMGMVRWINLDAKYPEIEWQVLGHSLIACGLRLDGRGVRSRHFVPAFIVGKDEQLQTIASLIVPTPHFKTNDRVVLRINNQQTSLRLLSRLLITDEFSQYEVVQI